jgi:hypothetical protein
VEKDSASAGSFCHRESAFLQEIAQELAMQLRQNVWVDGSLRDADWFGKVFDDIRARFPRCVAHSLEMRDLLTSLVSGVAIYMLQLKNNLASLRKARFFENQTASVISQTFSGRCSGDILFGTVPCKQLNRACCRSTAKHSLGCAAAHHTRVLGWATILRTAGSAAQFSTRHM